MSIPVMVLGDSGSGKSASLRNMNPNDTLLIQAIAKPLPFENNEHWKVWEEGKGGNIFVQDKSAPIVALMNGTKKKKIVIDDFQYTMANEFMRRSGEKGYDKFTEIGRSAWDIVVAAGQLAPDVRVYILSHTDTNDLGKVKAKTIGKMLDEKITLEGMFTIVLRCQVHDGDYEFATHNNGSDTVKSPMGMFKDDLIKNDLAAVDKRICEYYKLAAQEGEGKK